MPVLIAFAFDPSFIKKETVIGIIGKTQGVSSAANPLRKAKKNNPQ